MWEAKIEEASLRDKARAVFGLFVEHEARLAERLLDFLSSRGDIRVIGYGGVNEGDRASTISFVSENRPSREIAAALGQRRIGCSSGHFYAKRCVEALGIDPADGVVRVSMVHYNTLDEVDRLIAALEPLLG